MTTPLTDWTSVTEGLPPIDGEYLCWVKVPKRTHGSRPSPEHFRYMALEFTEGGFWISGGMPKGMVTHWTPIAPPGTHGTVPAVVEQIAEVRKLCADLCRRPPGWLTADQLLIATEIQLAILKG